jgi:hypothetical protein
MKIWDKYFAPHCPSADSAQNGKIYSIPVSWFNFITLMLATPEKFNWAKTFLNSALWEIISDESAKEESIKFAIPENCCVQYESSCCLLEVAKKEKIAANNVEDQEQEEEPITPLAPRRKRRPNSLLVESEVRRSPRIIELNGGFKNHDNCANKNCLSCNAAPLVFLGKLLKTWLSLSVRCKRRTWTKS